LEDDRGRLIDNATSGQTVTLAIEYGSQQRERLPNCRASIAVEDMLGQPMFVCSTEMISKEAVNLLPTGIMRCVIPRLPLSQGRYRLTLFLEVNKETQDWLRSVASFTVNDGDFFGSSRQYPEGWKGKCVLVPHLWSFSPNDQVNRKPAAEFPTAAEDSHSRPA
jgi:lipopolysaccharide transport system ATP-binding protein